LYFAGVVVDCSSVFRRQIAFLFRERNFRNNPWSQAADMTDTGGSGGRFSALPRPGMEEHRKKVAELDRRTWGVSIPPQPWEWPDWWWEGADGSAGPRAVPHGLRRVV
jgi:hypothetical protein